MIKFRVRSKPKNLAAFIDGLPRHVRGIATENAAEYIMGIHPGPPGPGRHGLVKYPPYRYITRKRAYGRTFSSDRQRRYVMARIREGRIDPGYPHRTGRLQRGWRKQGRGAKVTIVNDREGVEYVMGRKQARLNKLVGWRQYDQVAKDNERGAMREADKEIQHYIDSET